MKKLLAVVICAFVFTVPAYCQVQNTFVETLIDKLKQFGINHTEEKAYLQLDKPYYAAGDTIYFKAYVTTGEHQLSNLSSILHVDLIDPASRVNRSLTLKLTQGLTWGDFELPDSLQKGEYRVRAYTQLMQNDPGSFFDLPVSIGAVKNVKMYENAPASKQMFKADVQFFPEGGNMVTDVRNKVGFKAIGTDGLGTSVSGVIVDNYNKTVARFASGHAGMGSFFLLPEEGRTYRAKYKLKDSIQQVVDLPKPLTKGVALSVNTKPDKVSVQIDVNHNYYKENENKNIILAIYSGGKLTHVLTKLDSWELTLDLPVKQFATGVTRFTVFSEQGVPLCERLSFVQNPADQAVLQVSSNKNAYSKRDKVQIDINRKDQPLESAKGHYSVTVIDESKVPDVNYRNSIQSYLLLTSEVKGYIEQPDYYFDNSNEKTNAELDALMLTQGYRKFTWQEVLKDTAHAGKLPPEKAIGLSGTITSLKTRQPVANGTVNLVSPNNGPLFSQQTDANGRFAFTGILFADSTRFLITATDAAGNHDVKITMDKTATAFAVAPLNTPGVASTDMQSYLQNAQQEQMQSSLYKPLNGKVLKEVKVNALRSSNIVGSGHADQYIDMRKVTEGGGSLYDVLVGRLNGIRFINGIPYLAGYNHGPMQIVIDGVIMETRLDTNQHAMGDAVLKTLVPGDVETVEVLKYSNASIYGQIGGNGVLIVTTRQGTGSAAATETDPGILVFKAPGLSVAREFYSPRYDVAATTTHPDLRSTIYWQPEITTDAKGNASFNYYNADGTGTYRVIVEGIDEAGHIGRAVYRYAVR
ncbi:MG2 domain-containing protein [Mucilaginibacter agri]|uniref:TonB-dependent receptor n=1 Tax=Mucilaginibacter agri TaxID=2695265 RepID=A0A965ZJR5_9SPHI|nr:MG2 domain-containing protein [Mucilaginibacter agri]NCD71322.1 TonB-dependent receptor [Mucilaginibacter agri]